MAAFAERKIAKIYYGILTFFLVVAQVAFMFHPEIVWDEDSLGVIFFQGVILLLIYLIFKGFGWAKWVLMVPLLLFGGLLAAAGFELPSVLFAIVGLYHVFFALAPLVFKQLKPLTIKQASPEPAVAHVEDTAEPLQSSVPSMPSREIDGYSFPYLVDRYKAAFIDTILLLIFVTLCVQANEMMGFQSTWILVVTLFLVLSYEPVLITYSATVGQRLMKIRVRRIDAPTERISLLQAYIRFVLKYAIGGASLLTVLFDREKRAVHDMVVSSVVVDV